MLLSPGAGTAARAIGGDWLGIQRKSNFMAHQQYVCKKCGFNMVGHHPHKCPFCGAGREHFLTIDEAAAHYRVVARPVTDRVQRLNSDPPIGIEHAAYRVDAGDRQYWIDCPCTFDSSVEAMDVITLTHKDFLGSSNLYREHFDAAVWIHARDAEHPLAAHFSFDRTLDGAAAEGGLEAWHLGGHTPGYMAYLFEDVLIVGDMVFDRRDHLVHNPFGPAGPTVAGAKALQDRLDGRVVATVCGWDYAADYADWKPRFDRLVATS
jgi:hydroxyacylglutathione hydrolase